MQANPEALHVRCESCGACFPIVHGRPVLLRHDNVVFSIDEYQRASPPSRAAIQGCGCFILSPSVNLASKRMLQRVRDLILPMRQATVLVVGGGHQRQWLDSQLGTGGAIQVLYSDIDVDADVDVFCDGHDLPFVDGIFDAVIATAVLEHVLYPERVAAEISRVLKIGGLLYSEVPFMQQVHEGAYDFTRYTLSGHRRLFNHFSEIESGMVAGPATALVWAIENFALAFVVRSMQRKATKALVRFSFGWLRYFDHLLVNRPEAMDGASCTFFFGLKIEGRVPDKDIVAHYVGAKHVQHF